MMTYTALGGPRTGTVRIPASKSAVHRLLIAAALSRTETTIQFEGNLSADIQATAECLEMLGAVIRRADGCLLVKPVGPGTGSGADPALLPCRESGSTLRFLLPLAGALGKTVVFDRKGRLPERPLSPFDRELTLHGMHLEEKGNCLYAGGKLLPGHYTLPGNVSSQYVTGLLFALPLLDEDSVLQIEGKQESAGYIRMTEEVLEASGIIIRKKDGVYEIPGRQQYRFPGIVRAEGDWSNAAFFLCMGAFSPEGITVEGLRENSVQGDRRVLEVLREFGAGVKQEEDRVRVYRKNLRGTEIDASQIPDLIPVLSVVAAAAVGDTRIKNAGRLRLKESDRLLSTAALLRSLGAEVTEMEEELRIHGKGFLTGGEVDSFLDHRIAMAACTAATAASGSVRILHPECISKSYPDFYRDFESLDPVSGKEEL